MTTHLVPLVRRQLRQQSRLHVLDCCTICFSDYKPQRLARKKLMRILRHHKYWRPWKKKAVAGPRILSSRQPNTHVQRLRDAFRDLHGRRKKKKRKRLHHGVNQQIVLILHARYLYEGTGASSMRSRYSRSIKLSIFFLIMLMSGLNCEDRTVRVSVKS